jgi:hypothetical protein
VHSDKHSLLPYFYPDTKAHFHNKKMPFRLLPYHYGFHNNLLQFLSENQIANYPNSSYLALVSARRHSLLAGDHAIYPGEVSVAKDIENNRVNVVDGQQRLTTLKLILGEESGELPIDYAREANEALDKHFMSMAQKVIEKNWVRLEPKEEPNSAKR